MDDEPIRHPLDFQALCKGETIPAEKLEVVLGEKPGTDEYRFKAMKLCKRIEDEIEDLGDSVVAVCRKEEIRILSDAEASAHGEKLRRMGRKKIVRGFRKISRIDRSLLSEEQRADHERRLLELGRDVLALKQSHKLTAADLEPMQRRIPSQ